MDQWFNINTKDEETKAILFKKENADFAELDITLDKLTKWLKEKNILHGIRTEVLYQLIQNIENIHFPVVIAQGILPVNGTSAELIPLIGQETAIASDNNDKIDFKRLFTIPTVTSGQLIARKKNATEGKPGISVYGKPIPAQKGKEIRIKNGENTVFNTEDLGIYATVDGEVSFQAHYVNVYPVYKVNGDLSLKTDHINFVGNVHVTGNVPSGFKIQAMGDVRIEGLVEAAEISTPGSIVIAGGVLGRGNGLIRCGGNFTSLYVTQGVIIAGESITVAQSILYSHCEAGNKITCLTGKGNVSGGTIKAGNQISANEIGNETYSKTFIYIDQKEINNEPFIELELKINEAEKTLDKLQRLKDAMVRQTAQEKASSQSTINRIEISLNQTAEQLSLLKCEKNNLITQKQEESSQIIVKGTLYPNVEIGIGKYKRKVQSPFQSAKVFMKEKEIVIHSL
ncbi:DUF342 domain-containing protein [Fictibacillus barbaricus]|uniref:Uncharacterized protein (DUF342 family) n=1 Tax=Fictibacillus barbaricus TaxID=182136 RepID=A0ABU1TY76_9BACL|nr:FapA family protein [Fictibacillus barbaricus]MDR7072166.1 uncharacterized protein (DUF342 family) [Fictibacillus barbaricus]